MTEQEAELKLVRGMKDTPKEASFLENMRAHKCLEFVRRDQWDNSDQFRAFKCEKLPNQIYFDLFDYHNIAVGAKNATIIKEITGSDFNPIKWWGKSPYKYFKLNDEELNLLFSFLSKDD